MSDTEFLARLKISNIIENTDGTSTMHFDLNDEFIEWFKEKEGLKRFSHKRFSKFINEAISNCAKSNDKKFAGVVGTIVSEENK
ncbi:hypothetical protein CMI47_15065 [Candidatus Pacearchaeota archaeon]|nr:hypothetical protein [Candidatus Pacearchaeota archaeon]|tara:strand:- start:1 stop:252 length:252 start_codon:yes stop_codon:yes gene_type:complete